MNANIMKYEINTEDRVGKILIDMAIWFARKTIVSDGVVYQWLAVVATVLN